MSPWGVSITSHNLMLDCFSLLAEWLNRVVAWFSGTLHLHKSLWFSTSSNRCSVDSSSFLWVVISSASLGVGLWCVVSPWGVVSSKDVIVNWFGLLAEWLN